MSAAVADHYTTLESALILGFTTGRIRQLCRAGVVGKKFGRDWVLSADDISLLWSRPKFSKFPKSTVDDQFRVR